VKFKELTSKNSVFFIRYYKLVALAVLITVAVIVGSLVTGDSVRATLVKRVTERLGQTETVIFSRNSFMADEFAKNPLFGETARGILLTNGFISYDGQLLPVYVWGVDDRSIPKGAVRINRALWKELGGSIPVRPTEVSAGVDPASAKKTQGVGDALVLRLPASGLIPSGSLFVTENYTASMRLTFDGIVDVKDGGNISMKNEQVIPWNVFVNREELAEVMETSGKINLILSPDKILAEDLEKVWDYRISGLSVSRRNEFTEISSDRVFLQEEVVAAVMQKNRASNRLFSYLANAIEKDEKSIPYSFVTASDRYKNRPLQKDEIILSDYSAERLQARPGDCIRLSYFTSLDFKTLKTDTVSLRVKEIVPIGELEADKTLSAEFPGLSDVDRCTDWDSDLPIDMDLITDEDEAYWERYRHTPKAIIAYDAVAGDWGNAYGNATAIRIDVPDTDPNLADLRPGMFGIQLIYPREAGLFAARNGVDFSSLFLALGFFIVVSALLLMLVPLSEMLYKRKDEINLLKALGYTRQRITQMLWKESAHVVRNVSIVGAVAGLLYTTLIMWLLGNVWKGATHTDGFSVYPDLVTIPMGLFVGVALTLGLLRWMIVQNLKEKRPSTGKKKQSFQTSRTPAMPNDRRYEHKSTGIDSSKVMVALSTLIAVGITGINFLFLHSVILFVVAGVVLIGTAAVWGHYLIGRNGAPSSGCFRTDKLVWSTLLINRKQVMLSFFTLAMGVFIVFSVGLNRKGFADSSQIRFGTGGYTLWCESSVPIYHNMATTAGREKLSLTDLPAETEILQCLRYSADDASCLNLNKVVTPTVLGVDMDALSNSDFRIEQNLYDLSREDVFRLMTTKSNVPSLTDVTDASGMNEADNRSPQAKNVADVVYPALIDATVLAWSLMMDLGDTLHYTNDKGQKIALLLVGTLSNSIFQGHLLIDRRLFSEIWEETSGSEVFLLKTSETETENVKVLLSQALNEYGVRITITNDRLKQFNAVTDTYLTIFLTLGGLGLLLGIMSFIIVVRKNLAMRHREIMLYRTFGFTDKKIERILYHENRLVPLYAVATGVTGSLVGASVNFANTGTGVRLLAVLFTFLFVICVIIFVRKQVSREVKTENDASSDFFHTPFS
jgi:putative ABC transport system permease protein